MDRGRPLRGGLPLFLCALILLGTGVLSTAAPFTAGVEGLASLRGELVPGVVVLAFDKPGPGPGSAPVAVAAPTGADGKYRLALPPGQYHVVAIKTAANVWTGGFSPGDLFCYYLGNPVAVAAGRPTQVAFNLIRVPAEQQPAPSAGAGVAGRVTAEGKPLGRAYLYVYREAENHFRGLGESVVPTDERGEFRVKLAPGRYYLLARKRKEGGMYGPPRKDDYVGYYFGNPVEVRPGSLLTVQLEATTRVDLLEGQFKEGKAGFFQGLTLDDRGKPVPGLYVLLYAAGSEGSGTPTKVAGPTDQAGRFRIQGDGARYRIVARANLGGPPEEGEWYGVWRGRGGEPETEAEAGREIRITVERHRLQ